MDKENLTANPFDNDYLWYIAVMDQRDQKTHTMLTPKQKKALRNAAIVFLSNHGMTRNECCELFDIGATMVSTIVSKSSPNKKTPFQLKKYKMTQETADRVRQLASTHTGQQLAKMFDCSMATISNIINNKTWIKKN